MLIHAVLSLLTFFLLFRAIEWYQKRGERKQKKKESIERTRIRLVKSLRPGQVAFYDPKGTGYALHIEQSGINKEVK